MDILRTPNGTPIPVVDGEAFPLTRENAALIGILDADYPGTIDTMMGMLKEAIFIITGIDPTLSDEDWYAEWSALMSVNSFADPIHVLGEARRTAEHLRSEEASA